MAERVVDDLEVVHVDEQHGDRRSASLSFPTRHEQRAIREIERVVERLVAELLLQRAAILDGLLEPVVLQRDSGVVGQRLEQAEVVGAEARSRPMRLASMIVPIVRSSPGSIATIAWRTPRAAMWARSAASRTAG